MTPEQKTTLLNTLARVAGTAEVLDEPDLDLYEAGVMDSMAFVELLVALDEDLGLVVPPTEVDRSDISSVNKLLAFADERL